MSTSAFNLKRHLKTHNGGSPRNNIEENLDCSQCEKNLRDGYNLKRHEAVHKKVMIKCKYRPMRYFMMKQAYMNRINVDSI